MRESIKAVFALVLVIGLLGSAVAWLAERPDQTTWLFRIGMPTLALAALGVLLNLQFQKDEVPDYLRRVARNYFNRDGFCFAFSTFSRDGVCYLQAHFQNQRDQPSLGRIALRPARGFFLGRAKIETITFEIPCQSAAFGVARLPIPIAKELQGKRQSFEVGASVDYPEGRGRRVRYFDGIFLRTNAKFGNSFGTALVVAGALTGSIVMTRPAKMTLLLPSGVADEVSPDIHPETFTNWKLGDTPLEPRIG